MSLFHFSLPESLQFHKGRRLQVNTSKKGGNEIGPYYSLSYGDLHPPHVPGFEQVGFL
jgi:hypothetical protein